MFLDFLLPKGPSVKRHLLKTISWRIVGTVDTIVIAWLITGEPLIGFKIGGVEVLTKMVLYFIHERIWFKVNMGLPNREREINTIDKKRDE